MGTTTYTPSGSSLSAPPAFAVVTRNGVPLANVLCLSVSRRAGADPGVARFRYVFDALYPQFPTRIEQVLGLDAAGPFVVQQDDRIQVAVSDSLGGRTILFDGLAQVPQGDLSPEGEQATFEAVGVAARCWDSPIRGAVYRSGPDLTAGNDVQTTHRVVFNPDGLGNRCPDAAGPSGGGFFPFVDPALNMVDVAGNVWTAAKWTVDQAAAYILATANDGEYVGSPPLAILPVVLCDQEGDPIPCQDLDVTGKPWPEALADLVAPHNFDFGFTLSSAFDGTPATYLKFFRTDGIAQPAPKSVPLQPAGQALDPGLSAADRLSLARDGSRIANQVIVQSRESRHEVGIVLAPGFAPDAKDATDANRLAFDSDNPAWSPANLDKYRVYVAGEDGGRFWDLPSGKWASRALDLDAVLGGPRNGFPQYASHRRVFRETLFTQSGGEPRRARLFVSKDYNTPIPGVWDRTGSWCEVKSDWELLPDRLGIRITTPRISQLAFNPAPYPGFGTAQVRGDGRLSLVECINGKPYSAAASPPDPAPRVFFMVVAVIDSDAGLDATAARQGSSVSAFTIQRVVDARDRFEKNVIGASSIYNATGQDITTEAAANPGVRDDGPDALDYARGLRAAVENPRVVGSIGLPQVFLGYQVGDRIGGIAGRGISLRTNGQGADGGPQYPTVVSITWEFGERQSTSLELSDLRRESAPPPEHQK